MLLCDEGGEEAMGTNVNYLIEEYGISVNNDCMVRTVHQKYFHPKETLVTDGILNRAITTFADKKSHSGGGYPGAHKLNDSMDGGGLGDSQKLGGGGGDNGLTFVMPYASTLMVQKPSVAILSSGKIAYPMQRPVGALWKGVEARGEGSGRLAVLGSGRMADDEWLDREDNAKILDFVLRWLSPDSQIRLYDLDAEVGGLGGWGVGGGHARGSRTAVQEGEHFCVKVCQKSTPGLPDTTVNRSEAPK